jgi:lysophospholipase L1-like esterase/dienelactone hydrolase
MRTSLLNRLPCIAFLALFFIASIFLSAVTSAVIPSTALGNNDVPLPKILLVGSSIRQGYTPVVTKRLEGWATVISVKEFAGNSKHFLKHLDELVIREKPAVVHIHCGMHDIRVDKQTHKHQVELPEYIDNLRKIISRIRSETKAAIVFANITPVLDARHAARKSDADRFEADVQKYNAAATALMQELGVPVHDLHWAVEQGDPEKLLGPDGIHYTPEGYEVLGETVADSVLRALEIAKYPADPPAPPSVEAGTKYHKEQAERDAQVPAFYKKLPVPELPMPQNAEAWQKQRPEVLRAVVDSLGDLPPRSSPQRVRRITREIRTGYTVERVSIDNGVDSEVTALVLIPDKHQEPAPAILWLHSSTPDKNQILTPNTNGGDEPLGEAFVRAGYVVMAPDACWYGDRADTTPGGPMEGYRINVPGRNLLSEYSLTKYNLWFGRTLWGMFVRDDQIALDYLCSRPEVDKNRIGATGMSMGSTRAWWLAAVDERIAATAAVACLTRYQNLIAHGELRAHGPYYFVYGLLKHYDTEAVISLIAPRPFLALTGDLDHGSPADGIHVLEDRAGGVFRALNAGDRFKSILYENTGHVYSAEMRAETLAWFNQWLKPAPEK